MSFFRNFFRALSPAERRVAIAAAALLLAGLVGLAVHFIRERTVTVPAATGSYTEGMVGQPSLVNPVLAASEADQGISRLVFADLEHLSESIEVADNGKLLKVHLKPDLQWSDGEMLTSDDVVFTLQAIQNPASRSPLAGLFEGVSAERVSALETDFRMKNMLLASEVRALQPIPKHLYGDVPVANWHLSEYNLRPVGSGPYVFSSHDNGNDGFISAYRLSANPHYAADTPYIQHIKIEFYRNADELLSAFNGAHIQGFGTTDPALLERIQRPYALSRFTSPTIYAVFWNDTTNPALGPLEVREALSTATERTELLPALKGYGHIALGPFPPALFQPTDADANTETASTSSTVSMPATGAARAAALLESKGWRKGDDGIWTKKVSKANVRLEFTLSVPDIRFLRDAAQKLVDQWHAFGVAVHMKVITPGDELSKAITNRSYDGLLFGNTVRGAGDLYPFWHSSGRFAPGLNLAIYKNAQADTLLERLRTDTSPASRAKDMQRLSDIVVGDAPAAFLFSTDDLFVSSKNVRGISEEFLEKPADRLKQLPQWYVATARKLK